MAAWRLLGPSFVAGGVIVLAIAFLRGEASLALVVVFPVITATGALAALGMRDQFPGMASTPRGALGPRDLAGRVSLP